MKNQEFILLILNCQKYREKAIRQKETWLTRIPNNLLYFHIIGQPTLSVPYHFVLEDKLLYVKCEDDYNSLPKKISSALQAIKETYHFRYIFKTDDDQRLVADSFFPTLMKLLEAAKVPFHYGGYRVKVKQPHISQYYKIHSELPNNLFIQAIDYCNGRFYFLSKEAVNHLLENKEKIQQEYLEDYAIGLYLSPTLKENMLDINTSKSFVDY